MTAVASPPSVQSAPRLGWSPAGNGGQGALTSMSAEEVSRMLMPRKSLQRSNSSSSLSSTSSTSTISAHPQQSNASQGSGNESGNASIKKKPSRYIWSSSKSEPVSGVTNARPQTVSVPPSGTTASSAMSALHQPSPIVPSQHMLQSPQQNGVRVANRPSNEPSAILTLLPLNGTFERKQINVPYFPEILRIGRQTNAKTLPTPANGYFDSKVLSRQHAEVWADRAGKIWIRDVKSSNGTFVNGQRLSPENRDSEPHELREHDILELGIDIISEDQKSIVHHKVSAKVEHAGVYGPNMNILDLNFGDIDPTTSGGLLPHHMSQPLPHMRGRLGSSSSNGSSRSAQTSGGHMNILQQQRQLNYWSSPISIEQVVKRLSSEMKQAKQQNLDLDQTNNFLTSLMSHENGEKPRVKPSSTDSPAAGKPANVRPKLPKNDSFSRFSEPPAPPPQQPLPEKPDAPNRTVSTDFTQNASLRRTETEKPKGPGDSPTNRESSQILSLVEALASAKKELDVQAVRVNELEGLLRKEQTARETAENRARTLASQSLLHGPNINGGFESKPKTAEIDERPFEDALIEPLDKKRLNASPNPANPQPPIETSEATANGLQARIDSLIAEMAVMKREVETYKQSSERAENEAAESRKSLADMIENVRRERAETNARALPQTITPVTEYTESELNSLIGESEVNSSALDEHTQPCQPIKHTRIKEHESAATAFAKQRHHASLLEHSAPYASMIGVVFIGVGIMAYLNGWQKLEK